MADDTMEMMLKKWIITTRWDVLPVPLWILIASPLLTWVLGGTCFARPVGRSLNPLRRSFWRGF